MDSQAVNIPRVSDPQKYLDELFGTSFMEGAPTFHEFLEQVRGIPRTIFNEQAWQNLALQNEMMGYNMVLKTIFTQKQRELQEAQSKAQLEGLAMNDLMATRNAMANELDQVDSMISKAAQAQVDQAKP